MIRHYIKIINVVLFILVAFLVNKIYNVWKPSEAKDFTSATKEKEVLVPVPKLSNPRNSPRKIYQDIVTKDLFRPERTEWKPPVTPKPEEVPIAEPKIRVYGIVISDDLRIALVKEEVTTVKMVKRGRRRKPKVVKSNKLRKIEEGDSIKDWVVSTIKADAVILKSGESSKEFHLIERNDPKARNIPRHLQIKTDKNKAARRTPKKSGSKGRPPVRQPKKRKK